MSQVLLNIDEVIIEIKKGNPLILAGDEKIIQKLPPGNWIAGSIPYFMADKGGEFSQDKVFVTRIPSYALDTNIKVYDEDNISNIYSDIPENAFGVVIIPGFSRIHTSFAIDAPHYDQFAYSPLIGWISGVYLDELGKVTPKVYDGRSSKAYENGAIIMHIKLPANKMVELGIVNLFTEGNGDTIEFFENSFSATDALVNGTKVNFATYCKENKIDVKRPLVSNYSGAMINTSFQSIGESKVDFYAPVFSGLKYHQAADIGDYATQFKKTIDLDPDTLFFTCNCILNYLYGELENKTTNNITGPITFGEIAYQLLNQTLAYAKITSIK